MSTNPGNERSLKEANDLQRDLKTDRYQVVVQNNKRQKVEYKVTRLQVYETTNTTAAKSHCYLLI